MTGMPNRRALEGRLDRQRTAASGESLRGACVLMEVDFFRRFDHQFGRHAGEAVLRMVAAKLLDLAGASAFAASLGGGRFAFLPGEMTDEEAAAWSERLRQDWAEAEILAGERRLQFTASFGVAGPDAEGPIGADELLRRCEEALDLAEASGGDCVVRYGELNDQDEAWSNFAAPGRLFEGAAARDVMTPLPCVLRPDEPADEALTRLRRGRIAALPVVDESGKQLGIVTEDCLAVDLSSRGAVGLTVGKVMKRDASCLDENASFAELVEGFSQDAAPLIIITHDGRPTGLATPENLVVLGRKLTRENLAAAVPYSPLSDYLVVPDLCPAESA